MVENFKENPYEFADYDSELLLKILKRTSVETDNSIGKELFVDENWKINSKIMNNINSSDNSNLERILSKIFPNKKISIQNNKDGSQSIFLY
tara:strand:- start:139 stop:414 length:276 start_codon:yes stop_codon:yes gene_type:complete